MSHSCQCPCGHSKLEIHGEPIVRFICHCTICQRLYKAPYVDANLYKLDQIELPEDSDISYGKYKRVAAIDRGLCPECNHPVMAKVGEGEKAYGFVATKNHLDADTLPPAEMHVYYGTRVEDVDDDLPKFGNFITSNWAFIKRMMGANKAA